MLTAIQNTKILAVDTSPAMLEVLKNFASKHGFDFDSQSDPENAVAIIERRVEQFEQDFRCVLLGWPQGDAAIISNLLSVLNSSDNSDLPLVIVSQEITPQILSLTKQRARTTALLWKDYQQAADLIERLPLVRKAPVAKLIDASGVDSTQSVAAEKHKNGIAALLIDDSPSIGHTLNSLMVENGYSVTVAETADVADRILGEHQFDLIVTEYQMHDKNGSNQLSFFREKVSARGMAAMLIVVSANYTDRIIKHSLSAGAVACLFKNESSDLMFARIHALASSMAVKNGQTDDQNPTSASLPQSVAEQCVADKLAESAGVAAVLASKSDEDNSSETAEAVRFSTQSLERAGEPISKEEFNVSLRNTLETVAAGQHAGVRYSVLLLDVQIEAATGDRMSIGDSSPMCEIVERALSKLYKRPHSLSYLGNGQFAMLLANRRFQDALMLTRKVLQVVPRMVRYLNNMTLVSHSSVVRIDGATSNPQEFLEMCRIAVAKTRKDRRDNCALVMPLQKYLTALDVEGKTETTDLGSRFEPLE